MYGFTAAYWVQWNIDRNQSHALPLFENMAKQGRSCWHTHAYTSALNDARAPDVTQPSALFCNHPHLVPSGQVAVPSSTLHATPWDIDHHSAAGAADVTSGNPGSDD